MPETVVPDRVVAVEVEDRYAGIEQWWEFEDLARIQFEDEQFIGQADSVSLPVVDRPIALTVEDRL